MFFLGNHRNGKGANAGDGTAATSQERFESINVKLECQWRRFRSIHVGDYRRGGVVEREMIRKQLLVMKMKSRRRMPRAAAATAANDDAELKMLPKWLTPHPLFIRPRRRTGSLCSWKCSRRRL
jgi:hypothetical protein